MKWHPIYRENQPEDFTEAQRLDIEAAWRAYQIEESADRSYNFDASRKARDAWDRALNKARSQNGIFIEV